MYITTKNGQLQCSSYPEILLKGVPLWAEPPYNKADMPLKSHYEDQLSSSAENSHADLSLHCYTQYTDLSGIVISELDCHT